MGEAAGSHLSDASLAQLERLVEEQHRQVLPCHTPLLRHRPWRSYGVSWDCHAWVHGSSIAKLAW